MRLHQQNMHSNSFPKVVAASAAAGYVFDQTHAAQRCRTCARSNFGLGPIFPFKFDVPFPSEVLYLAAQGNM